MHAEIATNKCAWLLLGTTELCGKKCKFEHCKTHRARLKLGPGTQACISCGKGTKNKYSTCYQCGYCAILKREYRHKARTLEKEFKRLSTIEIFN